MEARFKKKVVTVEVGIPFDNFAEPDDLHAIFTNHWGLAPGIVKVSITAVTARSTSFTVAYTRPPMRNKEELTPESIKTLLGIDPAATVEIHPVLEHTMDVVHAAD